MNNKILTVLATAGVAALGITGVGYAQRSGAIPDTSMMQRMHGMSDMSGMMNMMGDCPMMQSMAEGPAAALKHRDSLRLSDAQVQRLEAIQARSAAAHRPAMERMKPLHDEINGLAGPGQFDEAAARRVFTRMGALHTEMNVAMLRARHETRETLTADQRTQLGRLGGGMKGMMGMMDMMGGEMYEMMKDCPMMKGGMGGMHSPRPDAQSKPDTRQR